MGSDTWLWPHVASAQRFSIKAIWQQHCPM